jgi:hypothetical protein
MSEEIQITSAVRYPRIHDELIGGDKLLTLFKNEYRLMQTRYRHNNNTEKNTTPGISDLNPDEIVDLLCHFVSGKITTGVVDGRELSDLLRLSINHREDVVYLGMAQLIPLDQMHRFNE